MNWVLEWVTWNKSFIERMAPANKPSRRSSRNWRWQLESYFKESKAWNCYSSHLVVQSPRLTKIAARTRYYLPIVCHSLIWHAVHCPKLSEPKLHLTNFCHHSPPCPSSFEWRWLIVALATQYTPTLELVRVLFFPLIIQENDKAKAK